MSETNVPVTDGAALPPSRENPWPVALVGGKIGEWIDRLGSIWLEGEITQWNSRGHVYGKLRDLQQDATLSFTIWSSTVNRFTEEFKQGDRVVMHAKVNFWVKGGQLSLNVTELSHVGLGELLARLERLRQQLAGEGLFLPERKKRLPFLPGVIGLVTGRDSDAEKDVKKNAVLRWPGVRFKTHYAAVQGDRAAGEVVAAIEALDADPEVEVIIVARGGGDFLHLLPFSDEGVVRAAANACTPLVSAIGHEADRPLLDEVADLRASTPTDAAKRVVPDMSEELALTRQARRGMRARLEERIAVELRAVAQLRERPVIARPETVVDGQRDALERLLERGRGVAERILTGHEQWIAQHDARLGVLSPLNTLARGYAIAQLSDGTVLRDPAQAASGSSVRVRLEKGQLQATVL